MTPAAPATSLIRAKEPARPRGRVLLVDDDPLARRAVGRILERAGFAVRAVDGGRAALDLLGGCEFDVVLSDVRMPDVDGIDLIRHVRARDLDTPVVLITGEPSPDTAFGAVEHGAAGYLTKPVRAPALLAQLERAHKLHEVARLQRRLREHDGRELVGPGDLEARFAAALERLRVVFQPVVRWSTRSVLGWEAFLRSDEPSLGRPGQIIAAAERLDRVQELGRRVRAVCAAAWTKAPPDAVLFMNLHPLELRDPLLPTPDAALAPFAERVVLEVTERACLGRVDDAQQRIAELRSRGYRIAVDDIGDGYASLMTCANLEPDFIKIDRTLVGGVHDSFIRARLVSAFADLCADLGTTLIAETVETPDELTGLLELGCDCFQGHLFAAPDAGFPAPAFPPVPGPTESYHE